MEDLKPTVQDVFGPDQVVEQKDIPANLEPRTTKNSVIPSTRAPDLGRHQQPEADNSTFEFVGIAALNACATQPQWRGRVQKSTNFAMEAIVLPFNAPCAYGSEVHVTIGR